MARRSHGRQLKSTAAMEEGVWNSTAVIAIINGPCVNADRPDDSPDINAYFSRLYCLEELRLARDAGVFIQPVIGAEDKGNIGALVGAAPEEFRDLGHTECVALNQADPAYWAAGVDKII